MLRPELVTELLCEDTSAATTGHKCSSDAGRQAPPLSCCHGRLQEPDGVAASLLDICPVPISPGHKLLPRAQLGHSLIVGAQVTCEGG